MDIDSIPENTYAFVHAHIHILVFLPVILGMELQEQDNGTSQSLIAFSLRGLISGPCQ